MGFMFGIYAPTLPEVQPLRTEGTLLITVTSNTSQRHVTLRLRCTGTDNQTVGWGDAHRVFFTDFDGTTIAAYNPITGALVLSTAASGRETWTVGAILRWMAGRFPILEQKANVDVAQPGLTLAA
jgi:hypothetical protein